MCRLMVIRSFIASRIASTKAFLNSDRFLRDFASVIKKEKMRVDEKKKIKKIYLRARLGTKVGHHACEAQLLQDTRLHISCKNS